MFINFCQKKMNPDEENSFQEEKVLKARERKSQEEMITHETDAREHVRAKVRH